MQIETSIIGALKLIGMPSNITPILSDRDGVTPKAPYLIINVMSSMKVGIPRKSISHRDGFKTESVFQVKDFIINFTLHAKANDPAHDWFSKFETGIDSDLFEYSFYRHGLGIVGASSVMYQPQPMDGSNYKRAILDVTFRSEVTDEYTIERLNGVEIEGDLSSGVTVAVDKSIV